MTDFLAFVKQQPLPADTLNSCPACCSTNVTVTSRESTMVGGPNHHWHWSRCVDCNLTYCFEFFDARPGRTPRNVWFTRDGHVLRGVPSCYEHYTYDCAACDGPVTRYFTKLDGTPTETKAFSFTTGRLYRTFFTCAACKAQIEAPFDHWSPPRES